MKKRRRRRHWRRFEDEEFRRGTYYIVPNIFTTANLFSGFVGIVSSIDGDFAKAAIAILASTIFDILDGKVARLTKATSRFGVEYDSLADLVSFGVGPGLLMYLWALKPFGRIGWLAAFIFVACGALRLARFNVQTEKPGASKKYFTGLPIPGAALGVATVALFFDTMSLSVTSIIGVVLLLATYVLAFLMVSTIPFNSFKDFEFVKAKPVPILFGVLLGLTIVAISPGPVLFLAMLVYIAHGPVLYLLHRSRGIQDASLMTKEPDPVASPEEGHASAEQTAREDQSPT